MSSVAEEQIIAERKRLEEARNIANSEKRLYVKVVLCCCCCSSPCPMLKFGADLKFYRISSIKRPRRLFQTCPDGPGVYLKQAFNLGPAFINEVFFFLPFYQVDFLSPMIHSRPRQSWS